MRTNSLAMCLLAAALAVGHTSTVNASGGFFVEPGEPAKAAEHRMLISISPQSTTIIDQIVFTGTPDSFAWLLPVKGQFDVGLSSDALFSNLDKATASVVLPPPLPCDPGCGGSGGGGGGGGGGTAVLAEKTLGPYETVVLSFSDPAAVNDWMASHDYDVPPDVQPVIDSFVGQGYDFLAIKLAQGAGIDRMQPVRVTIPGAVPTLPLRIAVAGVAPPMPARLFVVSQGRQEPKNFPFTTVDPASLVWSWDTSESNYDLLRQDALDSLGGAGWLLEQSEPFAAMEFQSSLLDLALSQPASSGYGDFNGNGAPAECQADLDAIFGPLNPATTWVTRLSAELSTSAFSKNLALGASNNPNPVPREVTVDPNAMVGTPPECPCGTGGAGGTGGGGTGGAMTGTGTGGTGGAMTGSGTGGSDDACTPGQQVECACPGGAPGAQACLSDGSGYEACQCVDPAAPEDKGGCGCTAAGAPTSSTGVVLGLLALAGAHFRRRRSAALRRGNFVRSSFTIPGETDEHPTNRSAA